MDKSTFKLDPKPTFELKVSIPVPGEGFAPITFTCRYRSRKQYRDFLETLAGKSDAEVLGEILTGWDIGVDFTEENIAKLAENYIGAAASVLSAYAEELTKVREKN